MTISARGRRDIPNPSPRAPNLCDIQNLPLLTFGLFLHLDAREPPELVNLSNLVNFYFETIVWSSVTGPGAEFANVTVGFVRNGERNRCGGEAPFTHTDEYV